MGKPLAAPPAVRATLSLGHQVVQLAADDTRHDVGCARANGRGDIVFRAVRLVWFEKGDDAAQLLAGATGGVELVVVLVHLPVELPDLSVGDIQLRHQILETVNRHCTFEADRPLRSGAGGCVGI